MSIGTKNISKAAAHKGLRLFLCLLTFVMPAATFASFSNIHSNTDLMLLTLVLLRMARTTKPLTNTEVKQAKGQAKEYNLADGDGLSLRVKPNGSKLWLLNYYRPHTKKRANIGFGTYPEGSLAEAHRKREAARSLLAKNIDPKEHREEQERKNNQDHLNTLRHVATVWFEIKKKKAWKKGTGESSC